MVKAVGVDAHAVQCIVEEDLRGVEVLRAAPPPPRAAAAAHKRGRHRHTARAKPAPRAGRPGSTYFSPLRHLTRLPESSGRTSRGDTRYVQGCVRQTNIRCLDVKLHLQNVPLERGADRRLRYISANKLEAKQ